MQDLLAAEHLELLPAAVLAEILVTGAVIYSSDCVSSIAEKWQSVIYQLAGLPMFKVFCHLIDGCHLPD